MSITITPISEEEAIATINKSWAKKLLRGIETTKRTAEKDQRSNPSYWSAGDPFGPSLSDFKDADSFVDNKIISYILEHAQPKVKQ